MSQALVKALNTASCKSLFAAGTELSVFGGSFGLLFSWFASGDIVAWLYLEFCPPWKKLTKPLKKSVVFSQKFLLSGFCGKSSFHIGISADSQYFDFSTGKYRISVNCHDQIENFQLTEEQIKKVNEQGFYYVFM